MVLHDTTEITYRRAESEKVGYTRKCANRQGLFDQKIKRAMCGILMHSSLVLTQDGLPLGFAAKKFWFRDKFKGVKALYAKKNATRIPIEEKESYRWIENLKSSAELLGEPERIVHVGDRESDIYDFFRAAQDDGSHFLVRIKVEESKLRTADGLAKLISIYSLLSWRIFWMTMLNRETEKVSPKVALTRDEIRILDHLKPDRNSKTLSSYITKIARLGGYLARASDPPPGNKVIWRGMEKLTMIQVRFELGKLVGN